MYVPVPLAKGTVEGPTVYLTPHHCQKWGCVMLCCLQLLVWTSPELSMYRWMVQRVRSTSVCLRVVKRELCICDSCIVYHWDLLLPLRRFASRKSLPQTIVSDKGTSYLSVEEELKELLPSKNLLELLNRQGVEWKFIPKCVPPGMVAGGNAWPKLFWRRH